MYKDSCACIMGLRQAHDTRVWEDAKLCLLLMSPEPKADHLQVRGQQSMVILWHERPLKHTQSNHFHAATFEACNGPTPHLHTPTHT